MRQFIKCGECNSPLIARVVTATNIPEPFATTWHYKCSNCECEGFEPKDDIELIPAISIRQPWAWLIVNGYKDLENRNTLKNFRGDVLIHAGKRWDKEAYYTISQKMKLPQCLIDTAFSYEVCVKNAGGIVGIATFTGSITKSDSPWFVGPNAFTIENARPLPFTPCKGQLGFFIPKIDM